MPRFTNKQYTNNEYKCNYDVKPNNIMFIYIIFIGVYNKYTPKNTTNCIQKMTVGSAGLVLDPTHCRSRIASRIKNQSNIWKRQIRRIRAEPRQKPAGAACGAA